MKCDRFETAHDPSGRSHPHYGAPRTAFSRDLYTGAALVNQVHHTHGRYEETPGTLKVQNIPGNQYFA